MKIETQPLENHQVKLIVEIEPERLEQAKQKAGKQLAKQVRVPGFRPGKAPFAVILRQVGEAAILEEAMDILVQEIYPDVIKEAGITPYGPGSLTNIASTEPPVFEFEIPLAAEVTLGDYKSIRKEYSLKEITDEDVEAFLMELRSRQAVLEPVDRPADFGDIVTVRLSAERSQPDGDQDPALIRERSMPITIHPADEIEEKQDANEWPFPGFSHMLVGMASQDEKELEHTFSDESPYESLRGVPAHFKFAVEDVKLRILPEADDNFAASVGEFATIQALRDEIRHSLKHQEFDQYHQAYDDAILDEAVEQATIKIPPQMVEKEIDGIIENFTNRLQQDQMDIDLYLKSRKIELKELREEAREIAEKRIKRSLVIAKISETEEIQPTEEELQQETIQTLSQVYQNLSKKDARRLNDREVMSNLMSSVFVELVNRKTVERIRSIASEGAYQGFVHDTHTVDQVETEDSHENESTPAAEISDEALEASQPEQTVEATTTDIEQGAVSEN